MDIQEYRAEFPHIAAGYVHLNHAGVSGMNTRTTSRIAELMRRQSEDPIGVFPHMLAQAVECRERLARLMGVPVQDLALTKNTAHGLSIVADGLDWRPGDEVVLAGCEYPANSYPWLAQRDRGVECRLVAPRPGAGGRVPAAVGSQKWLLGPVGVGGLYVKPELLPHLRLVNMGAGAVVNVVAFDTTAIDHDLKPTVQRYEEGTPNLIGYTGLAGALEMLEEFGVANAAERILALTRRAMSGLAERGYVVDSPDADGERAGLVMFHHPARPSDEIAQALVAAKINVVTRGGRVRYAPHFYNTDEDIDRALAALP